jgi:transcriptional regulator with PAS, ATPase and Fis domain
MPSILDIKRLYHIYGNHPSLNESLEKSIKVAQTDICVLVIGESGVGKEFIPKIIHYLSNRKYNTYIAVNCGAIPEGTIDSELFGHEKGSFTGASSFRKGYFEVANGGTIFLDEIGELPISTQVRLLRVLENGEYYKVGSSKKQKTNLRIVAATNKNMIEAIKSGKFREDLYYRLNTVIINIPPLRERKDDIILLFKKFSIFFSTKYSIPVKLIDEDGLNYLVNYYWPGNIRQLRNFTEQITVVEYGEKISIEKIKEYLPEYCNSKCIKNYLINEIDINYQILFDIKKYFNELKLITIELIYNSHSINKDLIKKVFGEILNNDYIDYNRIYLDRVIIEKAIKKNKGKRKLAAIELGISERTLYRKIKKYGI